MLLPVPEIAASGILAERKLLSNVYAATAIVSSTATKTGEQV